MNHAKNLHLSWLNQIENNMIVYQKASDLEAQVGTASAQIGEPREQTECVCNCSNNSGSNGRITAFPHQVKPYFVEFRFCLGRYTY
jgi:hypothetical protein